MEVEELWDMVAYWSLRCGLLFQLLLGVGLSSSFCVEFNSVVRLFLLEWTPGLRFLLEL